MVRAWITQELEREALSAVGYTHPYHRDLSPNQPGSCSSRYVADLTRGGTLWHGTIEVAALRTRTKKQKGTLLVAFQQARGRIADCHVSQ
jgi:hypothetical protein